MKLHALGTGALLVVAVLATTDLFGGWSTSSSRFLQQARTDGMIFVPSNAVPPITEALAIARAEGGFTPPPGSSISASLYTYTQNPNSPVVMGPPGDGQLVWAVTVRGVTIPRPGAPGQPAPPIHYVHIVISATTGTPMFDIGSSSA